MPILLPDCGHSFCHSCIMDCFELLKHESREAIEQAIIENDEVPESSKERINNEDTSVEIKEKVVKKKLVFTCPEDE